MNDNTCTKQGRRALVYRMKRFILVLITLRWGLLQRSFLGGRLVFSSPIGVYWYVWPVLVIEDHSYRAMGYYGAIAVYWLRRGFRLQWKHPDAP
jgi:hypothetical protein